MADLARLAQAMLREQDAALKEAIDGLRWHHAARLASALDGLAEVARRMPTALDVAAAELRRSMFARVPDSPHSHDDHEAISR